MVIQFQRAERRKARLRLALAGPAGSGKTYSALSISFGLGGRVAMIDTERGSGDLYAHLGEYDVCSIDAPFTPEKYIEAIRAAESAGYDIIIIDSFSHAWAGPGGVLDIQGHAADKSGNSWTAWRQVTPRHNDLVDTILLSRCHIIATMRSKMDHIQTVENGKTVVKKVGMNPIQRDGMEYEFTVFMDLDQSHTASASKDRTSLFDGQVFKPSPGTGQVLKEWLESGAEPVPAARPQRAERPQAPAQAPQEKPQAAQPVGRTPTAQGRTQASPPSAQGQGNAPATERQVHAVKMCIDRAAQAEGCQMTHQDQALLVAVLSAAGTKAAGLDELTRQEAGYIIENAPSLVKSAILSLDAGRSGEVPPWMAQAPCAEQASGNGNSGGRRRLF